MVDNDHMTRLLKLVQESRIVASMMSDRAVDGDVRSLKHAGNIHVAYVYYGRWASVLFVAC